MNAAKVRIIEPGWLTFTGDLGSLKFENGESVRELTPVEQQTLANNLRVETLEGKNPSSSQLLIDTATVAMDAEMDPGIFVDRSVAPDAPIVPHSKAELEAIADAEGIVGLRVIGDKIGVKGNSIVKLIEAILAREAELVGAVPAGEVTDAPAEPVVITAPEVAPEPVVEAPVEVAAPAAGVDVIEEAPAVESPVETPAAEAPAAE